MDSNNLPTKRNLIDAKNSLKLAKQGHDLLDKKRGILLIELTAMKKTAQQLLEKFQKNLKLAHNDLAQANMSMGESAVDRVICRMKHGNTPPFCLGESTTYLDEAYQSWMDVKAVLFELAEAQAAVKRLTKEMHHTQKRASALKNITIPKYETRIKYISEQLEERERDEMVRVRAAFH